MRKILTWILIPLGGLFLAACIANFRVAYWLGKSATRIDNIELYGLKTIPAQTVRKALGVKQGDFMLLSPGGTSLRDSALFLVARIPGSRFALVDNDSLIQRLRKIPGVENAAAVPVANPGASATLFVGIQEFGGTRFVYRPAPSGPESLPKDISSAYDDNFAALAEAIRDPNSQLDEDDSQGHALFTDPKMRAAEQKAIDFDKANLGAVISVLRNSAEAHEREAAAWAIGYAPYKRAVVPELIDAAHDPDEHVRNTATRAIGVIAEFAANEPETGIHIDPAPFAAMLNSVVWTDRNKGTMVLLSMSPEALQPVRGLILPSLIEMAHWKDPHFEDALRLLGHIAGMPDEDVEQYIKAGDRNHIIDAANRE